MNAPDCDPVVEVIDLDVSVGTAAGVGVIPEHRATVTDLVNRLDQVGIHRAVAFHIVAREHAPRVGNQMLLKEIANSNRLIPAFVLLPPATEEQPAILDLVAEMVENGIRMVRLFPASGLAGHRFALREWCIGPLLTALEEAGIPVGIDFSLFRRGEPPWDDIVEIASAHPDLRIALMDVQGRNNRTLYPLLERFPTVFIGSGGLNVHTGLEDVCRRFGAHRVFFSSGWPARSFGAARFTVDRSALSEAERRQVFSGTAHSLLAARPSRTGVSP
jgi:predicted TIM-barrel fold metal-dependent hydrolase